MEAFSSVRRLFGNFLEELKEFVRELTGTECEVERLKTKYSSYSSFVISCDKSKESVLLDPDEWEKGVLIRPFYGNVSNNTNENLNVSTNTNENPVETAA